MANTATYLKDPASGKFFSEGADGMVPVTDPNTLSALSSGGMEYGNINSAGIGSVIPTSSGGNSLPPGYSTSNGSVAPGIPPATGMISVPTSTGSNSLDQILGIPQGAPPPPSGSNPYTLFNNYIASILTQIQTGASAGRANLGGAINTLTNTSVSSAGPYNPQAAPDVNVQNQTGTMGAFAPALTSLNTQLENANAGVTGLTSAIPAIAAASLPQQVSGGNSLITPSGQITATAPVYNPAINPLTNAPYGWSTAPVATGSGGTSSGIATSTGNVDVSTYSTNPSYKAMLTKQYAATSTDIKTLSQQLGGDPSVAITQYIKNNAPKSQITGAMINSAATQYGIDPAFLAAQMLLETDFGTAGEAPANNNPGGVKFVGQPGATRGSPAPDGGDYASFASWTQGVAAEAAWIAKNQSASVNGANEGSGTTGGGLVNIQSDAQGLANGSIAPQVLQARYAIYGAQGGTLYNQAIALAKQINPNFNETAANLAYQGQQTNVENLNSGNPITSIFSNLKNSLSTPAVGNFLNPSKPSASTMSNGVDLTQFNK